MLIERVKVVVPVEITNEFKKKAKLVFPNEAFAYLLGHEEDNVVIVDELFFPKDVDSFCTPGNVHIQWGWGKQAQRRAKKIDGLVLGDIHSHPYTHEELTPPPCVCGRDKHSKMKADMAPSEQDWEAFKENKFQLMGLCIITETKNKRLRAKTKFWGPLTPLVVKET